MKCPRRMEGPFRLPDEDNYLGDGSCSYCGSMNPDEFMARIEKGDVELGPTDKNYKVYVRNMGGEKFKLWHSRKCPDVMTCPPESCAHWTKEERDDTKFYFMHLSEEQMKRFVVLYNEKKMQIGYPGHFYALPYFMRRQEPGA